MQKMLKICQLNGNLLDNKLNPSKSASITFGNHFKEKLANLHFGNCDVCWVNDVSYLGMYFISSSRLKIDICPFVRKLYGSAK